VIARTRTFHARPIPAKRSCRFRKGSVIDRSSLTSIHPEIMAELNRRETARQQRDGSIPNSPIFGGTPILSQRGKCSQSTVSTLQLGKAILVRGRRTDINPKRSKCTCSARRFPRYKFSIASRKDWGERNLTRHRISDASDHETQRDKAMLATVLSIAITTTADELRSTQARC